MQIVVVISDVLLGLLQQEHDINSLFDLLGREMAAKYVDVQLFGAVDANVLIGAIVVGPVRIHLVKDLAQILLNLKTHRDLLLKKVKVVHLSPSLNVGRSFLERVSLLHVWNENL